MLRRHSVLFCLLSLGISAWSEVSAQTLTIEQLVIATDTRFRLQEQPAFAWLVDEAGADFAAGAPATGFPASVNQRHVYPFATLDARQGVFGSNGAALSVTNGLSSGNSLRLLTESMAFYEITVSTTSANTPLRLAFSTLGGGVHGAMNDDDGDMWLGVQVEIGTFGPSGILDPRWGFSDALFFLNGGWSRQFSDYDRAGIGLPGASFTTLTMGATESASLEFAPFSGVIDFGLLQPGETFRLGYRITLAADGQFNGVGSAVDGTYGDPFGGAGGAELVFAGANYGSIVVIPETGTYAAWLGGATLLAAGWRRFRSHRAQRVRTLLARERPAV